MYPIKITDEQIERAAKLYDFYNLKGSFTYGKSQLYGALGEIVFADMCKEKGYEVEHQSTKDYDMIINGATVDVKTKRTTVRPLPHYLVSVTNNWQKCNFYVFLRITQDYKFAYMLGTLSRNSFFNHAEFKKKGDPDGYTGFNFKEDGWHLPVRFLKDVQV